jgi:hypothetical protein
VCGMLIRSPPSTIASVAVAIESALGYRYRHVWTATLPLAALLVERLGGAAGVLLPGLLASLGEMAAVREKASWPALQATLGTVLRIMGPERVLAAMPLNLEVSQPGKTAVHPHPCRC